MLGGKPSHFFVLALGGKLLSNSRAVSPAWRIALFFHIARSVD